MQPKTGMGYQYKISRSRTRLSSLEFNNPNYIFVTGFPFDYTAVIVNAFLLKLIAELNATCMCMYIYMYSCACIMLYQTVHTFSSGMFLNFDST